MFHLWPLAAYGFQESVWSRSPIQLIRLAIILGVPLAGPQYVRVLSVAYSSKIPQVSACNIGTALPSRRGRSGGQPGHESVYDGTAGEGKGGFCGLMLSIPKSTLPACLT